MAPADRREVPPQAGRAGAVLPRLRALYEMRVRSQRALDTAAERRKAQRSLAGLWLDIRGQVPEMGPFICTFAAWQEEILNYVDGRQTSGPVEGINNKARLIVKRAYGLKSAERLWSRLVLDLNRAKDVVRHTVGQVREVAAGFRAIFSGACA